MNNKGQSILSEYVMIVFVVIAALVAMTVYVQRGLEARVHAARNYMVDSVLNSGACDANCLSATGGSISREYEPYYALMLTSVSQKAQDNAGITVGNAQVLGVIYARTSNEATKSISTSCQLPPECAQNPPPDYCSSYC